MGSGAAKGAGNQRVAGTKQLLPRERQAAAGLEGRAAQTLEEKNAHAHPDSDAALAHRVSALTPSCPSVRGCRCSGRNTGAALTDP